MIGESIFINNKYETFDFILDDEMVSIITNMILSACISTLIKIDVHAFDDTKLAVQLDSC